MKGLIKLNNIAVKTVSSKCTTFSKSEGENEVKVKMYKKIFSNVFFNMIPPYNVNLMYIKIVKLFKFYLIVEDHF